MQINQSDAEEVMKLLDVRCYNCNGSGNAAKWKDAAAYRECDICYGTGYQPTGAGVELLNFLRRQRKRIERENV